MLTKKTFFCLTKINIIFTEIHRIKTKTKKIIKMSHYLTQNTFLTHPGNPPLKEIPFDEFKSTYTKAERPN